MASHDEKTFVCPWWLGYLLINPIRKLFQNPNALLAPYVGEGNTVLEVGPGMGYFTLPMAKLVGANGKIICVDLQEKMLQKLMKRAANAGLGARVVPVVASHDSLRLDAHANAADFALAFAVVHEVPDQARLFNEIYRTMKLGSLLLVSEPKGHVTSEMFQTTVATALSQGFRVETPVNIKQSISIILKK